MLRVVNPCLAIALAVAGMLSVVSFASAQEGGGSTAKPGKNPVPSNAASIAAGKAAFMRQCRFCHGEDAKGAAKTTPKNIKTPPPDLTDAEWRHGSTDGDIFTNIRNGIAPDFDMKPNKILKDEEIWQIVNYIRSLGPSPAK
jgi:mono/diheme cytochrome c family protein